MPSTGAKIAVLLVGGRSVRMGTDKFLMELNGRPQWQWMKAELSSFFDEVHIACRADQAEHFEHERLVLDVHEDIGPMGAIHASLSQIKSSAPIFFVACDMPDFKVKLAQNLHAQLSAYHDVVAAMHPEKQSPEPLVAFWSQTALPTIEQFISQEHYALFKCMKQLQVHTVEVSEQGALRNVNSPSDL